MGRSGRPSTLGAGKFSCTADFSKIAECDAVPLAIQTPFLDKKDLFPDFRPWVNDHRGNGRGDPRSGVGAHRRGGFRPRARPRAMVGRLIRNIREHDRVVGGEPARPLL